MTLAGSDYVDCFNKHKDNWKIGKDIVTKTGGKTLKCLLGEAVSKMKSGELFYEDLAGIPEYRKLLFNPTYMGQLKKMNVCVKEVAQLDYRRLCNKITSGEITSLSEITANDEWKLAYKYHKRGIEDTLQAQKAALIQQNCDILCVQIANKEITSPTEIRANEYWNLFSEDQKEKITKELAKQANQALREKLDKEGITSMDEILVDEYWKLGYEFDKNYTDVWCSNHRIPIKRQEPKT